MIDRSQPCELAALLAAAIRGQSVDRALIREFQDRVADEPETSKHAAAWEMLTELGTNLEFYVPDPFMRAQHRSYFGDEQLLELVRATLRSLSALGIDVKGT